VSREGGRTLVPSDSAILRLLLTRLRRQSDTRNSRRAEMDEPLVWVVRGGDNNELASKIKSKAHVAIGWPIGDISAVEDRSQLRAMMEDTQPGLGTPTSVGQVFRFLRDIQQGDYILTPEKIKREIHVTRCKGPYRYDPSVFGPDYPNVRPVEYLLSVKRDVFPQSVRNTLGSVLTVFRADAAWPYLQQLLKGGAPGAAGGETEAALLPDELEGQARGQILEVLDNIDHHDFQFFVAGVLEALKYETVVGGKGKDAGVDILAHPDTFGLASPRIKVQVKNQKNAAGVQEVGYLNGVLGAGEKGLFICTGGFSKDALNASFVRNGQVALVDGNQLLDIILEHYEQFPQRAKQLLPLRRLYVPENPVL